MAIFRLRCWFWKKKNRDEQQIFEENLYNTESRPNLNNNFDRSNKTKVKVGKQRSKKKTFPLTPNQAKLRKHKIKSYPVSPDRVSPRNKGYHSAEEGGKFHYNNVSPVVLLAKSPQFRLESKQYEPTAFPYQIPETSVPRRSSLFYGVKYKESVSEQDERPVYVAEKPMEDYNLPSTSKVKDILDSDKCNAALHIPVVNENRDTVCQEDVQNKTLIQLSSGSTENAKPRGDLFKMVKFSSDSINNQLTDGRVSQKLELDKMRASFKSEKENKVRRLSKAKSLDKDIFPENESPEQLVYATPATSTMRPSLYRSTSNRPPASRRSISKKEPAHIFAEAGNKPEVYAVPLLTRGRKGSVLQQSIKSMVSKADNAPVNKKNIRYSMDTDVFSTDVRRKSVNQSTPQYVNMEKGNPILVSDLLSPITSIFVTDLKDRVPKDPLTKPKEYNRWIDPQKYSDKRPSQPKKPPPKPTTPVKKRSSESSSSSEGDRHSSYKRHSSYNQSKSNQYGRRQQQVYAVELTENILPDLNKLKNENLSLQEKDRNGENRFQMAYNGDSCGLNCNVSVKESHLEKSPTHFKSPNQQSDEEIDILCYPSEKFLRASVLAAESGSKLRWRIIIKRVDDK